MAMLYYCVRLVYYDARNCNNSKRNKDAQKYEKIWRRLSGVLRRKFQQILNEFPGQESNEELHTDVHQ